MPNFTLHLVFTNIYVKFYSIISIQLSKKPRRPVTSIHKNSIKIIKRASVEYTERYSVQSGTELQLQIPGPETAAIHRQWKPIAVAQNTPLCETDKRTRATWRESWAALNFMQTCCDGEPILIVMKRHDRFVVASCCSYLIMALLCIIKIICKYRTKAVKYTLTLIKYF